MAATFLHTISGTYDRRAIMRRAWTRARNTVARQAKVGQPASIRTAFADALRLTWDEARFARNLAVWRAEQDRQAETLAQLDSRTREIAPPLTASTVAPPSAARSARSRRASPSFTPPNG